VKSNDLVYTHVTKPEAPVGISTITGANVQVRWTAPYNSGSTITSYTVSFKQNDGKYSVYDETNYDVALTATIPMSVLRVTPYNLSNGANVVVKV
jgi:hypothetical protein